MISVAGRGSQSSAGSAASSGSIDADAASVSGSTPGSVDSLASAAVSPLERDGVSGMGGD